ncbi:hypothetical protein RIF29_32709 [Crotalaria pallida]|uniref:Uncharacterized protein n=1 Tax=Crotalaria pallida TaxID=3830 RepID=A0AAN9EJ32_CROPI
MSSNSRSIRNREAHMESSSSIGFGSGSGAPPICGCMDYAVLRTVKKTGANQGLKFWGCRFYKNLGAEIDAGPCGAAARGAADIGAADAGAAWPVGAADAGAALGAEALDALGLPLFLPIWPWF